jgi:hypothetical protein
MKLLLAFPSAQLADEFAKRIDYLADDLFAIACGVYAEIDDIPDNEEIKRDLLEAASVIGGVEVKTRQQ